MESLPLSQSDVEGGKSHLMEHPKLFIRFPCNVVYAGIHGKFVNIRHILICHIKNLAKLLIIKNKGVFSQQKSRYASGRKRPRICMFRRICSME